MRASSLIVVALVLVGQLMSCASAPPRPTTVEPSPIVARYGDKVIRQSEVDAKAQDELRKLEDQLYELRTDTAERLALEVLVEAAAKREGLSADDWLDQRLAAGLVEPTEVELRTVFERARERLGPEVTFDDLRPRLRQVVEQEARAKKARALFAQLKKDAGFELIIRPPDRPRRAVEAVGPSRGPAEAKITIVEFADFECPFCGRAAEVVEQVLAEYPGKVRLVFRHFPLSIHAQAPKAAEASACADEQGRFWEFHDSLFESRALEIEALKAQAGRLGLDAARFERCLDSGQMEPLVRKDLAAGQQAGVGGTPAFFVNGVLLSGAQPVEAFRRVIDQELGL
jgi:protein-disulfide isomerase